MNEETILRFSLIYFLFILFIDLTTIKPTRIINKLATGKGVVSVSVGVVGVVGVAGV